MGSLPALAADDCLLPNQLKTIVLPASDLSDVAIRDLPAITINGEVFKPRIITYSNGEKIFVLRDRPKVKINEENLDKILKGSGLPEDRGEIVNVDHVEKDGSTAHWIQSKIGNGHVVNTPFSNVGYEYRFRKVEVYRRRLVSSGP